MLTYHYGISTKIHIHSTHKSIYSFKTPSFKNGEIKVKCECGECFIKLRDVASLRLKVDYALVKAISKDHNGG